MVIPYSRQHITDDDIAAVVEALKDDFLTQGKRVPQFETELSAAVHAPHAVAVNSGTAALHLVCAALKVKVGITSAITFAASANCLRYVGADVHFADVDPRSGLIDIEHLRELIKKIAQPNVPGVILPVSLNGAISDLPAIRAIADTYGWYVVEDAAHSLGGTYTHQGVTYCSASCAHTDAAILSFHPVKHVCTGEGGAVTTCSSEMCTKIQQLRSHGMVKREGETFKDQTELGWNYRMPDILAALGSSQLRQLQKNTEKRRRISEFYRKRLTKFTSLQLPVDQPGHAYHLFAIQLNNRDTIGHLLKNQGIETQVHYRPVYRHSYYAQNNSYSPLFGAETYAARCLSIPMFASMEDAQLNSVVEQLTQLQAQF